MNLYEKIQAVANEIMSVEKDMQVGNVNYGYKAVSDLNVTLKVKEAESKNKLISIPTKQEIVHQEVLRTIDGNKESLKYHFIIKMTTKIVDLEKTDDFVEIESFGHGLDSGDKGFGKASTYARKYALLNAYKIATGEDPDKDPSEKNNSPKTVSEKKKVLTDFLLSDNEKLQHVLMQLSIGDIEDISEKDVNRVYDAYKKKGLIA